jgi:hypothetical protein
MCLAGSSGAPGSCSQGRERAGDQRVSWTASLQDSKDWEDLESREARGELQSYSDQSVM